MKALKKYELNYLRHLYLKDLKKNKNNNDLGLSEKLDSIIDDAKLLSSKDEIMWTLNQRSIILINLNLKKPGEDTFLN